MYFVAIESVDHAASGFFESFGPVDVILLVESGTEFDEDGDFFAIFCCRTEVFYQSCFLCQPVDSDFDG